MKCLRMLLPITPILYVVMSLVTAAGLNASDRAHYKNDLYQSRYEANGGFAFSTVMALFPPMWLFAPLLTGFYHDGFSLESKPFPCTKSNYELWCEGNYPK